MLKNDPRRWKFSGIIFQNPNIIYSFIQCNYLVLFNGPPIEKKLNTKRQLYLIFGLHLKKICGATGIEALTFTSKNLLPPSQNK
jgi:hypothetical protein